jgi:protein-tyrosine phosphatase
MVCSGNICRSPTAEGVLRAKLERAGLAGRIAVDSAGTQGLHAKEAPDPRAQAQARKRGYDLSRLRARKMTDEDFVRFQRILAMDEGHLDWLQDKAPAHARARWNC